MPPKQHLDGSLDARSKTRANPVEVWKCTQFNKCVAMQGTWKSDQTNQPRHTYPPKYGMQCKKLKLFLQTSTYWPAGKRQCQKHHCNQ